MPAFLWPGTSFPKRLGNFSKIKGNSRLVCKQLFELDLLATTWFTTCGLDWSMRPFWIWCSRRGIRKCGAYFVGLCMFLPILNFTQKESTFLSSEDFHMGSWFVVLQASYPPPTDCKHVTVVSFEIKQHVLLDAYWGERWRPGWALPFRHVRVVWCCWDSLQVFSWSEKLTTVRSSMKRPKQDLIPSAKKRVKSTRLSCISCISMCRDIHQRFERLCSLNPGRPSTDFGTGSRRACRTTNATRIVLAAFRTLQAMEQGQNMVCFCILQYQETQSPFNWLCCKKILNRAAGRRVIALVLTLGTLLLKPKLWFVYPFSSYARQA